MITTLDNIPDNMVGFVASGEVSKEDFDQVVLPAAKALVNKQGKLNYLMQIDTDLKNFTLGAWAKDMLLGIQQFGKWNRCAIASDSSTIKKVTDVVSVLVPGEFQGFEKSDLSKAIAWVSETA